VPVDSTIARAHQHATNITRLTEAGSNHTDPRIEPPDHALGRSRGGWSTKLHYLRTPPPSRPQGGRPPTLDARSYQCRNVIEHRFTHLSFVAFGKAVENAAAAVNGR